MAGFTLLETIPLTGFTGVCIFGYALRDREMQTNVKTTNLDLTPSLSVYIEKKLGTLARYIKKFDEEGVAELWVEVGRTSRHHHKGEVFRAEANLRLPKKILRAVEENTDVHAAIDLVRDKLHMEIEKYKARLSPRSKRVKE